MSIALEHQLVNIRNLGKEAIAGAFGGEPYLIPPGEQRMLGVECAKKDLGDWDTRNLSQNDEKLRFRWKEYLRVRGLYGVHEGAKIPVVKDGGPDLDERGVPREVLADTMWRERVPKVEITLLDGTKVVGVLDDPEGRDLPAGDATESDKDLALASLKAQMEQMQATIDKMNAPRVDIPTDDPETAPRPQPKKAKVAAAQTVHSE